MHDSLIGTSLGGAEIQAKVSSSVLADIYRAVFRGEPVALKVLSPEAIGEHGHSRFVRESKILADLDHPAVIRIHRCGYERGHLFIMMEWIQDGVNLRQLVVDHGPLEVEQALIITQRLCAGLDYLHGRELVHRDIKPGNVCLRKGGQPVLLDFTLVKDRSAALKLTQTGTIMGTIGFMPPEQAEGRFGEVGPGSDLYALGATLFWLLTGQRPFKEKTPLETIIKVLKEPPQPPSSFNPSVPPQVDALVLHLMSKQPAARPASALDVAKLISGLL